MASKYFLSVAFFVSLLTFAISLFPFPRVNKEPQKPAAYLRDTLLIEFEGQDVRYAHDGEEFSFQMVVKKGWLVLLEVNGKSVSPSQYKLYPKVKEFVEERRLKQARKKLLNLYTLQ
jgi:hypothetical protein